jgi:hypothetical protein
MIMEIQLENTKHMQVTAEKTRAERKEDSRIKEGILHISLTSINIPS